MLRRHCDDVGRDYDEIEKTTMISIGPDSTVEGVVRQLESLRATGFTVAYVFAGGMRQPRRITDLLAEVVTAVAA